MRNEFAQQIENDLYSDAMDSAVYALTVMAAMEMPLPATSN